MSDQRGFGDQFDAVARGDLETAERFLGRERGRRRDQLRRHNRHLGFAGLVADLRTRGRRQAKPGKGGDTSGHTHKDNMNAPRLQGQLSEALSGRIKSPMPAINHEEGSRIGGEDVFSS